MRLDDNTRSFLLGPAAGSINFYEDCHTTAYRKSFQLLFLYAHYIDFLTFFQV